MELTPVACNHCGASLEVSESARFVTCRYCNSQLEIRRTESTITTEVLQNIDHNTAAMAEDLHAIRRETELERLDREWSQKQASLMTRDKQGNTSVPTATGGLIIAVIMGGFGLIWTIGAFAITSPDPHFPAGFGPPPILHVVFPLFGVVFVALAIGMGIKTASNAAKYQQEERRYQLERQRLMMPQQQESDSRYQN